MKKMIFLILSLFILNINSNADYIENIKNDLLLKIDNVVKVIEKKNINKKTRNDEIVKIISPMFDFELMSKLSIGRKWKKLPKEDKLEFTRLYIKRMKKSYSSKLDQYKNQKIEITDIKKPKKNRVFIETNIKNTNNNLKIVYKYYKPKRNKINKNKWLIYDVEISGVSILKTDKMQFKEFLKRNSFKDLIKKIS